MKKILKKCILLFVLILILIGILSVKNTVHAIDFNLATDFIEEGKQNASIGDLSEIGTEFSAIGNVLTYIGAGILVGATGYMGILYIISPPEKQAKLKQQLIGLVVSAIVIFGAYAIWSIIVKALEQTVG